MRRSKPGSHGSIRLNSSGLAHLEHGGRRLSTKLNLGGFFTVRSASAFPEIGRTEKGRRICSNGSSGFKNDFEMKNAPPRLCVPYNQLGFAVESKTRSIKGTKRLLRSRHTEKSGLLTLDVGRLAARLHQVPSLTRTIAGSNRSRALSLMLPLRVKSGTLKRRTQIEESRKEASPGKARLQDRIAWIGRSPRRLASLPSSEAIVLPSLLRRILNILPIIG